MELNKIINGNSLEVLKEMPENFIDTVITDPPYGLSEHSEKTIREVLSKWLAGEEDYVPLKKGFMDKEWDAFVPPPALWKEVYRVMKPGAAIMVFAGSRTYDLMTMALRLSGFEIKDTLMWIYGSGFPKGVDISKQIDKKLGFAEQRGYIEPTGGLHCGSGNTVGNFVGRQLSDNPVSPEAKLWYGYKTSLKPAYEPIILAIKPNDGYYADNALKWGVAGLNIEGSRIGVEILPKHKSGANALMGGLKGGDNSASGYITPEREGRFPTNVIFECTCDVVIEVKGTKIHTDEECPCYSLDVQSGLLKGKKKIISRKGTFWGARTNTDKALIGYDDMGGASKFFYCAKASKRERHSGLDGDIDKNTHPTVKPISLCEYLVKLTSMPNPNQVYLDPFAGSGSILMAVKMHGKNYIGIEMSEEYARIAMARLASIK